MWNLFQHERRVEQEVFSGDDVTSGSATAQEPSEEETEHSLEDIRNVKRKQRTRYTFIRTTAIRRNVGTNTLQYKRRLGGVPTAKHHAITS